MRRRNSQEDGVFAMLCARMRICIVYDCLFPYTVGGGERWYRNLAERLAQEGHEVTYLTLRQWDRGVSPEVADGRVRVVKVGPRMALYTDDGRRRILPPLTFGVGVLWHLLRHGRRYQVVRCCSFPYFSLLSAALARPLGRYRLEVDWFEVWSDSYWREYLGGVGGRVGGLVQRACARVPQRAFCLSRLHAKRLREEGLRGEPTVLRGLYTDAAEPAGARDSLPARDTPPARDGPPARDSLPTRDTPPARDGPPARDSLPTRDGAPDERATGAGGRPEGAVLFAGRLIPEKQAPVAVAAIAQARGRIEGLRGVILGDGPEREAVLAAIARLGLRDAVWAPGFTATETVEEQMRDALCLLLPSLREGYGLVVVEAAARGTPSIVVAAPDNAAVELIEEGVNGFVCPSSDPQEIAEAIVKARNAGAALRASTARWFAEHADELGLESSLRTVLAGYAG
jgi:glycosyltransferase involved in cell wall biosynthesis